MHQKSFLLKFQVHSWLYSVYSCQKISFSRWCKFNVLEMSRVTLSVFTKHLQCRASKERNISVCCTKNVSLINCSITCWSNEKINGNIYLASWSSRCTSLTLWALGDWHCMIRPLSEYTLYKYKQNTHLTCILYNLSNLELCTLPLVPFILW